MNILLHICCAPCAIYAVETIRLDGHSAQGLFYNPNIHPYVEYERRRGEVGSYASKAGLDVVYAEYEIEKFFQNITFDAAGIERRCPGCWELRMAETAKWAGSHGFEAFTTTLLGSPYQDHETLKEICGRIAAREGVKFYYKDFRTGFRQAHNRARAEGIYCQKYCGCLFSERERMEKIQNPKSKIQNKFESRNPKMLC